jgi:hypothetical protein
LFDRTPIEGDISQPVQIEGRWIGIGHGQELSSRKFHHVKSAHIANRNKRYSPDPTEPAG